MYYIRLFETSGSVGRSFGIAAETEDAARESAAEHVQSVSVNRGRVEMCREDEPYAVATLVRIPGGYEWREHLHAPPR